MAAVPGAVLVLGRERERGLTDERAEALGGGGEVGCSSVECDRSCTSPASVACDRCNSARCCSHAQPFCTDGRKQHATQDTRDGQRGLERRRNGGGGVDLQTEEEEDGMLKCIMCDEGCMQRTRAGRRVHTWI